MSVFLRLAGAERSSAHQQSTQRAGAMPAPVVPASKAASSPGQLQFVTHALRTSKKQLPLLRAVFSGSRSFALRPPPCTTNPELLRGARRFSCSSLATRHSSLVTCSPFVCGHKPRSVSSRGIPASGGALDLQMSLEVRHIANQFVYADTTGQALTPHSRADRSEHQIVKRGRRCLSRRGL